MLEWIRHDKLGKREKRFRPGIGDWWWLVMGYRSIWWDWFRWTERRQLLLASLSTEPHHRFFEGNNCRRAAPDAPYPCSSCWCVLTLYIRLLEAPLVSASSLRTNALIDERATSSSYFPPSSLSLPSSYISVAYLKKKKTDEQLSSNIEKCLGEKLNDQRLDVIKWIEKIHHSRSFDSRWHQQNQLLLMEKLSIPFSGMSFDTIDVLRSLYRHDVMLKKKENWAER